MIIESLRENHLETNRSIPWIEKYRPRSLNELISQNRIVETLQKFIKKNQLPNMLFYGSPGTGRTNEEKLVPSVHWLETYIEQIIR
jgi:replication factor C subunit 3/5